MSAINSIDNNSNKSISIRVKGANFNNDKNAPLVDFQNDLKTAKIYLKINDFDMLRAYTNISFEKILEIINDAKHIDNILGDIEIFEHLIMHCVDILNHNIFLMYACKYYDVNILKKLINLGFSYEQVNILFLFERKSFREKPLRKLSIEPLVLGKTNDSTNNLRKLDDLGKFDEMTNEMFDYLISNGVDINVKGEIQGLTGTPLHFACYRNSSSMVNKLLSAGARCNNVNILNELPLHVACEKSNISIINMLVDKMLENKEYIDYEGLFSDHVLSPLHIFCKIGNKGNIDDFIKKNKNVNLNMLCNGYTPLFFAKRNQLLTVEYINKLISLGAMEIPKKQSRNHKKRYSFKYNNLTSQKKHNYPSLRNYHNTKDQNNMTDQNNDNMNENKKLDKRSSSVIFNKTSKINKINDTCSIS